MNIKIEDNKLENLKLKGIYKITNLTNGKCYVGST